MMTGFCASASKRGRLQYGSRKGRTTPSRSEANPTWAPSSTAPLFWLRSGLAVAIVLGLSASEHMLPTTNGGGRYCITPCGAIPRRLRLCNVRTKRRALLHKLYVKRLANTNELRFPDRRRATVTALAGLERAGQRTSVLSA